MIRSILDQLWWSGLNPAMLTADPAHKSHRSPNSDIRTLDPKACSWLLILPSQGCVTWHDPPLVIVLTDRLQRSKSHNLSGLCLFHNSNTVSLPASLSPQKRVGCTAKFSSITH